MSETNPPGTALAPTNPADTAPARRVTYTAVESSMGIMDTARFEHLGRVAKVMAMAGLMPETLTKFGPENKREDLPFEVIQARAYLIANQADLWHADPMAVAQCTSLVYNRLMYEGKLVHGIISARLGVDLSYEFGVYNPRRRDIDPLPADGLDPNDQSLGVRVSGTLPGETEPRTISGSVAMWHKGAKSPWGNSTAWPRQLRYMGAREWCRAHKPSLMLGIITDDEVDEYEMGRQVGAIAPAAPQMLHAGFEDRRAAQITGPTAEEARGNVAKKRAAKAAKVEELQQTRSGGVLDGDDIPAEGGARPTGTAGAQPAQSEPDTSGSATDASSGSAEDASGQQGSSEPTGDGEAGESEIERIDREARERAAETAGETITGGYPAADEVYHLDGDTWANGRRETYKNGQPFSSAGKGAGLKVYADHAPEGENDKGYDADDEGEDDLPLDFKQYVRAVKTANDFADVKRAMQTFYNTALFKSFTVDHQNKVRSDTWDLCQERGIPMPDQAGDISAFRMWIEWQPDADAIIGTLRALEQEQVFIDKEPTFKQAIRQAVANRVDRLQREAAAAE